MKKLYTTPEYKEWNKRRLQNLEKKLRKKRLAEEREKSPGKPKKQKKIHDIDDIRLPFNAPSDFRLIENTEKCLLFFRNIRSEEYISTRRNIKFVIMSLKEVELIDYASISVLTAISDDIKYKGIILKGDLPDDTTCKKFMEDSGYLNHLFDSKGKPFNKSEKSDLIFFEKGSGILSDDDNRKISTLVKNVVNHLTGESRYCLPVKTIILEICGNSIEWGGTDNKQWLLGVKYEEENVIFTVTDVGKGILETLHRKYSKKLIEDFTRKKNDQILMGAFDKKYGSSTKEVNRNKGLPSVKAKFEQETINNLKVLTNNVILHFDNEPFSKTFEHGSPRFRGTFYQWIMTKDCLNKITIE